MAPLMATGEAMDDRAYEAWFDQHSVDLSSLSALTPMKDVSGLEWLTDALGEGGGSAAYFVPRVYEAYGRVLFPFLRYEQIGDSSAPVPRYRSWEEVARDNGKIPHALMQSDAIAAVGDGQPTARGPGSGLARSLITTLLDFTSTPEDFIYLFWNGYGNIDHRRSRAVPLVELPGRECYVLEGDVSAFVEPPLAIQLCFPADRAWCYGADTDLDFAYVATSQTCLDALAGVDDLEVYQIDPDASIWRGGDVINSTTPRPH